MITSPAASDTMDTSRHGGMPEKIQKLYTEQLAYRAIHHLLARPEIRSPIEQSQSNHMQATYDFTEESHCELHLVPSNLQQSGNI
jgi:hypothetical protein